MSRRAKVLIGIALFSLFILAYISIRKTVLSTDLQQVELKLISAVRAGDNPDYLVCSLSIRNISDRPVYLQNLSRNVNLYIEGKRYPAVVNDRERIRLNEAELLTEIIFQVGRDTPLTSPIMRVAGKCFGDSRNDFELVLTESTSLDRRAVLRPKVQ